MPQHTSASSPSRSDKSDAPSKKSINSSVKSTGLLTQWIALSRNKKPVDGSKGWTRTKTPSNTVSDRHNTSTTPTSTGSSPKRFLPPSSSPTAEPSERAFNKGWVRKRPDRRNPNMNFIDRTPSSLDTTVTEPGSSYPAEQPVSTIDTEVMSQEASLGSAHVTHTSVTKGSNEGAGKSVEKDSSSGTQHSIGGDGDEEAEQVAEDGLHHATQESAGNDDNKDDEEVDESVLDQSSQDRGVEDGGEVAGHGLESSQEGGKEDDEQVVDYDDSTQQSAGCEGRRQVSENPGSRTIPHTPALTSEAQTAVSTEPVHENEEPAADPTTEKDVSGEPHL